MPDPHGSLSWWRLVAHRLRMGVENRVRRSRPPRSGVDSERARRRSAMGRVFFSIGMSLDGFIAPEGMNLAHAHDPTFKEWGALWMALHKWAFQQRFFR